MHWLNCWKLKWWERKRMGECFSSRFQQICFNWSERKGGEMIQKGSRDVRYLLKKRLVLRAPRWEVVGDWTARWGESRSFDICDVYLTGHDCYTQLLIWSQCCEIIFVILLWTPEDRISLFFGFPGRSKVKLSHQLPCMELIWIQCCASGHFTRTDAVCQRGFSLSHSLEGQFL